MTIIASTIRPVLPLRLSWRMSQTRKATNGATNTAQNINDANPIFIYELRFNHPFKILPELPANRTPIPLV